MNTVLTDQPLVTAGEGGRAAEDQGGRNNINNRRKRGQIKARGDVRARRCANRQQKTDGHKELMKD